MSKINLKNVIWKEGKYFVGLCLNINVSSFGKTKKEAVFNLNEAIELYFEDEKNPIFVKVGKPELINSTLNRV
jgi:predicted RNase H-like HicB family nuclease